MMSLAGLSFLVPPVVGVALYELAEPAPFIANALLDPENQFLADPEIVWGQPNIQPEFPDNTFPFADFPHPYVARGKVARGRLRVRVKPLRKKNKIVNAKQAIIPEYKRGVMILSTFSTRFRKCSTERMTINNPVK